MPNNKLITGVGILGLGVIGSKVAQLLFEQNISFPQQIKSQIKIISYFLFIFFTTFILSVFLFTPTIILGNGIDQFINNKYFRNSDYFGKYPEDLFKLFLIYLIIILLVQL